VASQNKSSTEQREHVLRIRKQKIIVGLRIGALSTKHEKLEAMDGTESKL